MRLLQNFQVNYIRICSVLNSGPWSHGHSSLGPTVKGVLVILPVQYYYYNPSVTMATTTRQRHSRDNLPCTSYRPHAVNKHTCTHTCTIRRYTHTQCVFHLTLRCLSDVRRGRSSDLSFNSSWLGSHKIMILCQNSTPLPMYESV